MSSNLETENTRIIMETCYQMTYLVTKLYSRISLVSCEGVMEAASRSFTKRLPGLYDYLFFLTYFSSHLTYATLAQSISLTSLFNPTPETLPIEKILPPKKKKKRRRSKMLSSANSFRRPAFSALPPTVSNEKQILSLPDLIRYNGEHNKDHLFCIQTETNQEIGVNSYGAKRITFGDLENAVENCAEWMQNIFQPVEKLGIPPLNIKNPVAVYMESDVGLFVHIAALQALNIPVS